MRSNRIIPATAILFGVAALTLAPTAAFADTGSGSGYAAGTPSVAQVSSTTANPAPWTLAQGSAVYPGATTTPGTAPFQTGYSGTPGPLAAYCSSGGASPESGSPVNQPVGSVLNMSPYYFPHVERAADGTSLQGFFDYRPKDVTEAIVAARSTDNGKTWIFQGKALEENSGLCPNGNTDVNAATESDDGQGHPFDLTLANGTTYLYTLNRPSGDTLGSNLIAHQINLAAANPLAGLPAAEPTGLGGATTTTAAGTIRQLDANGKLGGTSTVSLPVVSTANAEIPDRIYVTGTVGGAAAAPTPVYCAVATATAFTGCYSPSGDLTFASGAAVSVDPVTPATATATSGLTAPDGILAVLPASKSYPGVPAGATTVLYVDKQLGYFTPTTLSAAVTLPLTNGSLNLVNAGQYSSGTFPITVYLGSTGSTTPVEVTCTGSGPAGLTGCTSATGTASGSAASGNSVGSPGSCVVDSATLGQIGEGSTKPKTLFKNNEDYAAVQMAYTTDGTHFTDVTPAPGITGLASPTAQSGLRWAAPSGTVITNPDGSLGIFYSAGVCTDGDSDAFGSLYYASSTDGLNWSTPQKISSTDPLDPTLSTDYTFAGSQAAQKPGGTTDASTYYGGRIYSPSVIPDRDGSLTMVFAGYRTPKPLPAVGSLLGRGATQYQVSASDPALYRDIMTVTLTPSATATPALPESALATALPLTGLAVMLGGALMVRRRRATAV